MKLSSIAFLASLSFASFSSALAQTPTAAQPPAAVAQRAPPVTAQTSGNLARFIVGPGGRVRGLVLDNGAVAMLPPRAANDIAGRVRVGQPLRVEGLTRPGAGTATYRRVTVRAADGTVLVTAPSAPNGAPGMMRGHGRFNAMRRGARAGMQRGARLAAMPSQTVGGAVQQVLSGPRGNVRALLLANNATVFVPRTMIQELTRRGVRVGERVQASGRGNASPQGTGLVADRITFADGTSLAAPVAAPVAAPTR